MMRQSRESSKSLSPHPAPQDNFSAPDLKAVLPGFLRLFLPSVLVISLIAYGLLLHDQDHQQQLQKASILSSVELAVTDIELTFRNVISDLRYLAESDAISKFMDSDKSAQAVLASDLLHFTRYKGIYDQLRFLDTEGVERVRINYNAGQSTIVPEEALQNKKGRYYFDDTLHLSRGEIFVSPLDLNIEQGQIEQPLKPMIRFGMPVFDPDGRKKGIVLLNFLAERLLGRFSGMAMAGKGSLSLLNRDGYWLSGPDSGEEWGFMFPNRKELIFGNRFPKAWHEIRVNRLGLFQGEMRQFIYTTVYPIMPELRSSTGTGEAFTPSSEQLGSRDYFWKVVAHYPTITLVDVFHDPSFLILYSLAIVGITLGAWFRSHSLWQLQQTVEQLKRNRLELKAQVAERTYELRESHEQLELLLASTGEGLYGIDTQGRCTFANRSALEILGYQNEGQLLGKNMHELIHYSHADGTPYDVAMCPIYKSFQQGSSVYRDNEVLWRADGSAFAAEYRSFPTAHDGVVVGAVVTFNDVTERKRNEEAHRKAEELFSLLLDSTAEGIYGIDTEGACMFVNPACVRMLGYDNEDQLSGLNIHNTMHHTRVDGSTCPPEECRIIQATHMESGTHVDDEIFWRKDGTCFPVEYWSYPLHHEGTVIGAVVTFFDITDRKRSETEREQILHDMGERMKELKCMFEITEAIRKHAALDDVLYDAVRIIPPGWHYPEYTNARIIFDNKEFIESAFELTEWKQSSDLIVNNECRGSVEVYYTKEFPKLNEGPFHQHERNLINGIAKTLSEAIEHKQAEVELEHLATHDPLTELYNRKMLIQKFTDELFRASRYNRSLSLFMLDIDHFKQVNDTYGHQAGDAVLQSMAKKLKSSIRKTDYAARYGGEEFIIILPETPLPEAEELAERLRSDIAGHSFSILDDKELNITVSIGVATFPKHAQSWEDLLSAVDSAMYAAKRKGRNCVQTVNDVE